MSDNQGNGKWVRITQLVMTSVAITAIPWCVWATNAIHNMDVSIARLESFASAGGRFTSEHGQSLKLELTGVIATENAKIWQELANIQSKWLKEISTLNTQIATLPQTLQLPPEWWEKYVRGEIMDLDRRVKTVEAKVNNN